MRDVIGNAIVLALIALIVGLFAIGVLPFHASGDPQGCHSAPARYGGAECPDPAARFRIDSGELEWE